MTVGQTGRDGQLSNSLCARSQLEAHTCYPSGPSQQSYEPGNISPTVQMRLVRLREVK